MMGKSTIVVKHVGIVMQGFIMSETNKRRLRDWFLLMCNHQRVIKGLKPTWDIKRHQVGPIPKLFFFSFSFS